MWTRTACALTPEQADRRGMVWIFGSFVLCPCHLPITLAVVGALLSGTAIGAYITGHVWLTGIVLGVVWLAGTLHGFNWMRRARLSAMDRPSTKTLL